jgi:ribonuclease HII
VLVDGFRVPGLTAPSIPIVKGDQAAACVSAASILAKVTRDRIMIKLHDEYPVYGFDEHKGYCTAEHGGALERYGPCVAHRWSFVNVLTAAAAHGRKAPHKVAPHCYLPATGDPTPTVNAEPAPVVQNESSLTTAGRPDHA